MPLMPPFTRHADVATLSLRHACCCWCCRAFDRMFYAAALPPCGVILRASIDASRDAMRARRLFSLCRERLLRYAIRYASWCHCQDDISLTLFFAMPLRAADSVMPPLLQIRYAFRRQDATYAADADCRHYDASFSFWCGAIVRVHFSFFATLLDDITIIISFRHYHFIDIIDDWCFLIATHYAIIYYYYFFSDIFFHWYLIFALMPFLSFSPHRLLSFLFFRHYFLHWLIIFRHVI